MTAVEIAQVVEGWSTLVAVVVALGGGFFIYRQLRTEASSRQLQAAIAVREFVSSEQVVAARRFVVRQLPPDYNPEELTDDQIAMIDKVTLSYQYAGHLLWLRLVKKQDIIPDIGTGAIWHWQKLKPWIEHMRQERPESRIHFEYLVVEAAKFIRDHADKMVGRIQKFGLGNDDVQELFRRVGEQVATRAEYTSKVKTVTK